MTPKRPLDDYAKKRDFGRTREPKPRKPKAKPRRKSPGFPQFVVHRHEARNLHYDFRFDIGGALASFAVPRGFSYDPREKRLAVHTEDHPIDYLAFRGTIPKGEYGAGTMTIWDRGWYEPVLEPDVNKAIAKGEVKLALHGKRLRGEWHLVKTKQGPDTWLLFKSKDVYAGHTGDTVLGVDLAAAKEAAFPKTLRVMEPGAAVAPFSDPDWLFEMEFTGRRVLAEKRGSEVKLRGVRASLPEVERDLAKIRAENALLDGVLVESAAHGAAPVFYAFDLLYFDEFDLRPLPLLDRKAALRAILPPAPAVLFTDHVLGSGEQLAAAAASAGVRAVIAKRAASPYRSGASDDWRTIDAGVGAVAAATPEQPKPVRTRGLFKPTNPGKVFWPAEGFTKGDLLAYYERVADVLLPYLKNRPVHMNRFPDGIEGKSFYQRHAKAHLPAWIPSESIPSESKGQDLHYVICNDRDALLTLVNLGSIDLHPWLSRRGSLESPDWCVLDLDAKQSTFPDVVRVARAAGKLLRGVGLRPLLKTSGKTGMHIYVPLKPGYTYDQSRMFCEAVARVLARDMPDIATVERTPAARGRRVYLDFGQNRKSQTVVPPYVVRPVRGATVSTPLHWDELSVDLTPLRFTMLTVPDRLDQVGDLFRPALTDPQDLMPAIEALQREIAKR